MDTKKHPLTSDVIPHIPVSGIRLTNVLIALAEDGFYTGTVVSLIGDLIREGKVEERVVENCGMLFRVSEVELMKCVKCGKEFQCNPLKCEYIGGDCADDPCDTCLDCQGVE